MAEEPFLSRMPLCWPSLESRAFSWKSLLDNILQWDLSQSTQTCRLYSKAWDLPTSWPLVLWACITTWSSHGPSTTFLLLSLPSCPGILAKTISTHHVRNAHFISLTKKEISMLIFCLIRLFWPRFSEAIAVLDVTLTVIFAFSCWFRR